MFLRIYLICGLAVAGFYVGAAVAGLKGPVLARTGTVGPSTGRGATGTPYIGGRSVGGSSSSWHGGK